jgi:hypothetical protein
MSMSLTRRVTDWLFFVPEGDRSLRDIVFWWEVRRVPYNLIVGGVGLCSLILFFVLIKVSGKLKSGEDAVEPLGLIVAPFVLNICYTAGWVVEALLGNVWSTDGKPLAPRLLKYGLGLSLAAVLLPSVAWAVYLLLLVWA